MPRAVPLTIKASPISARLGQYSLNRFGREVGRTIWRGQVGYNSRRGALTTVVPDLFTIQVMSGLLDKTGQLIPPESRQPQLFLVQPEFLPASLRRERLAGDYAYLGFSPELVRHYKGRLEWAGGFNLEAAELAALALTLGAKPDGVMLVNLSALNGTPRGPLTLLFQLVKLQERLAQSAGLK